ncbi:MAG: RCC1 domain-containing protein [Candidatus Saccharimonadales bacterium]
MVIRPHRYRFIRNIAIVFVTLLLLTAVVFVLRNILQHSAQAAIGQITHISPDSGLTTGGETVTITGEDFAIKENSIVQVATGSDHTVALDAQGNVYTWGENNYGQLGNGSTTDSSFAINISSSGALSGKTIVQVAAGSNFSLALDSEGNAYSWGNRAHGRLGNGYTGSSNGAVSTPVAITPGALSGKTIVQVAAGSNFSLALDSDGKAYGWGRQQYGRLGNGSTAGYSYIGSPVEVIATGALNGKTLTQISAGADHALALDSDGVAYSWGYGDSGRLGNNSTSEASAPVAVTATGVLAGKKIMQVSAGDAHSLAVDSDGKAYAWGAGGNGRLGQGSTANSSVPVAVVDTGALSGKAITSISAGSTHSLALASDGTMYAWGAGTDGRLGTGNTTTQNVPVVVGGGLAGKRVTHITAGAAQSLALTSDGALFGWGNNGSGRLGDGTTTSRNVPTMVSITWPSALADVVASIPRVTFGEVEATDVTVVNSTTITATTPAHAAGMVDVTVDLGSGDENYMATRANGYTYRAIGEATSITPNTGPQEGGTAVTITGSDFSLKENKIVQSVMGSGHSLALSADGKVYSWGVNTNGRLGDGTEYHVSFPIAVKTEGTPMQGKRIVQIAGGNSHSLALASDGTVYAWGSNSNGQLGNNNTGTDAWEPVAVSMSGVLSGKRIVQIAGGNSHSLALDSDGKVYAWGLNDYGQLGNNSTTSSAVPVAVSAGSELGSKTITQISAGNVHSTAVASDGGAYAWGRNNHGQLGDGTNTDRSVPTFIFGAQTLVQVVAGDFHTVALDATGYTYAWGYNAQGQVGNNTTTSRNTYANISFQGALTGKTIVKVAAGYYHSMAIDSDGNTYSWGMNNNGQVGNNSTTNTPTPVAVTSANTPMQGKRIVGISAGYYNSMALSDDGLMYTWGQGDNGRLGNNMLAPAHTPVAVTTTAPSALATMQPILPAVYFGDVAATNVTLVNPTTITATTPAHAPGPVNVTIDLGGGDVAYRATLANGYTYVTPPPAAPTNLTATPADIGVQLAWTAPQNTGGSPISDYRIEYSPDHGATWQVYDDSVSTATSLLVPAPPLEAGMTYRFRVAAINQTGQGLWSNQPEAAMRYVSVAAPTAVSIDVTPGSSTRISSGSHAANVSTNSVTGYTLSLAANNQTLTHANNSDTINPVGGTPAAPTQLTGASWGFRVPNIAGFGSGGTVEQNVATSNYLWAGLPAPASEAIIRTQTAAVENQSTTVWYGVSIPPEQPAGTYAQTVTYTVVARD